MKPEKITGNLLLRHGFQFRPGGIYTLDLPVAEGQFALNWERLAGLYLGLGTRQGPENQRQLHRLSHIQTLKLLQHLYKALTNQPLSEIPETSVAYQQEITARDLYYRKLGEKYNANTSHDEAYAGRIKMSGSYFSNITPRGLKMRNFLYRKGRYEFTLECSTYKDTMAPFLRGVSCDLLWEEGSGLSLDLYQQYVCVGSIPLGHMNTLEALEDLVSLLTPRVFKVDVERVIDENFADIF